MDNYQSWRERHSTQFAIDGGGTFTWSIDGDAYRAAFSTGADLT